MPSILEMDFHLCLRFIFRKRIRSSSIRVYFLREHMSSMNASEIVDLVFIFIDLYSIFQRGFVKIIEKIEEVF